MNIFSLILDEFTADLTASYNLRKCHLIAKEFSTALTVQQNRKRYAIL